MREIDAMALPTPLAEAPETRLDRLSKEEFFDLMRMALPDLTWEMFDKVWADLARRSMN